MDKSRELTSGITVQIWKCSDSTDTFSDLQQYFPIQYFPKNPEGDRYCGTLIRNHVIYRTLCICMRNKNIRFPTLQDGLIMTMLFCSLNVCVAYRTAESVRRLRSVRKLHPIRLSSRVWGHLRHQQLQLQRHIHAR